MAPRQLPQAATRILTELLERNEFPPRDEKQKALDEIHALPGLEDYTHAQLTRWLSYRRRNAGRTKHEPVETILPQPNPTPDMPVLPKIQLMLEVLFKDSPPSDATLHLWDDVGTWLRNKRANSAQSQLVGRSTCTQSSQPRFHPTARQEVAPRAPPSAMPISMAYPRDWAYQPFAAPPSMPSSSAASNLAVKEEISSSPLQYNTPSSAHAHYSARGVASSQFTREWQDALRRTASGSHDDDHHLQHPPPTCQPPTRPAPYKTPSDSPPRIQRVYRQLQPQQRRHWQRAETPTPTSMFEAGPSTQSLQFFTRDAGAPMEGRPRTAGRQDPEPVSPISSVSPGPSRRSGSPSPSAGQRYGRSHLSLLSPPITPSRARY
ncbi:hypothetical protein FIBSPDRAFT_941080 [Athelia psychrophila]|uniref:Homeobox domain-containing protein n=1 Tax=Athelia psychrophila TaxID=1759441 RepID=A0A167UTW3_9AGAM|nr:hypothetical protein FIBSPDRAFT_941080 [Fibularhizoctonia sp. CBS 109695]